MDTELKNIHFRRALIIQDFALVEMAMNHLICLHFLKTPKDDKFISDFLENEYFSFQLRKKLFELAFRERYPKQLYFPWNSLERIQKLRNIIAHSRISEENLIDRNGKIIKKIRKAFYLYDKDKKDALSMHDEFKSHMDKIVKSLMVISQDTKMFLKKEHIIDIE